MEKNWMQIGGIAAIVVGAIALYAAGTGESEVIGIVAGVFVLAGIVAGILKKKE